MKTNQIKIKNWSVVAEEAPYTAPELLPMRLRGKVYGHPRHENGTIVTTSIITKVNGRKVETHSGSHYALGKIDVQYRKWIEENYNKPWDWKNPIVIIPKNQNDKYMMATTALHKLGDISRDEPDICHIQEEIDDYYIGSWVTGYGFIGVKFPKETTRELTPEEIDKYKQSTFQIGSQPAFILNIE